MLCLLLSACNIFFPPDTSVMDMPFSSVTGRLLLAWYTSAVNVCITYIHSIPEMIKNLILKWLITLMIPSMHERVFGILQTSFAVASSIEVADTEKRHFTAICYINLK